MKIKAISFNQSRIQRQNRWFTAYHNCINSSRCNKLFGLIFLMSIGAIFTAVIVMAVIRADLFSSSDNDNPAASNTSSETVGDENSAHIAVDGLLESLNVTPGEFDIVQDTLPSPDDITTSSIDDWHKNRDSGDDEEVTSPSPEVTTSSSTISFVNPTDTETIPNTEPPIVIPSKCNVQVGSGNCLIACVEADSVILLRELTRAINEDLTSNSCPMHNLHLLLESIRLPSDDEPEHDWLHDLNSISSITFVNFTISRSEIKQLNENSFANGPFSGVNHIIISDMEHLLLQLNALNGLTSLSTLTFKNIKFFFFANGFNLLPLSSTLTSLEISATSNSWSVLRLTGGINVFEKVTSISFSQNNFTSANFNSSFTGVCSTVRTIYLSQSKISQLSSNMFNNCTNLEVVDLANNLLTTIPQNIFEGTNLRYLYLENNQLQFLPDNLLPNLRLQGLRITNNPWNCSFEILYLKKLFEIPGISFYGGLNSTCSSPPELENEKISDIWCSRSRCKITCKDTDQETLRNVLKIYSMTNCTPVEVELFNHEFDDKQIPSYWLSNLTYSINVLNMISTSITFFEENAFNSSTFNSLKEMTIDTKGDFRENTLKLRRESFKGLNQIEKFEIISIPQIEMDSNQTDVFGEISPTVVDMSLANCNLIFMRRLFENSTFERIQNLNLSGNSFSITTIANTSFAGVQGSLRKLILSFSRIEQIFMGTFDYFQQLEEVDLQGNHLQTLPVDLFKVIKARNPNFRVSLEGNPWICNTDLCHLLEFINENVLCSTGEPMTNLNGVCTTTTTEIKTTEIKTTEEESDETIPTTSETESSSSSIPDQTSSSSELPTTTTTTTTSTEETTSTSSETDPATTTTTSTTTMSPTTTSTTFPQTTSTKTYPETTSTQEPTTESSTISLTNDDTTSFSSQRTTNSPGNFQIPCVEGTLNVSQIRFNASVISFPNRESITVYRPPILFTIKKTKSNEVSLNFEGNEDGMVLLYYPVYFNPFDDIDDDGAKCVVVTENVVVIGNLLINTVYTFCTLFNTPIFTPFQCMSYSNTEGMPWLYAEQKAVIITSLTLILLFVLTAGIIMTYFLIRRMPTLIRGSKRVVIVNNRTKEVMILPRSDNDSRSNSFRKDSVVTPIVPEPPTYLTPRPRQSVEHRPPFVRSNSDTSLKSYVSVSRLPPRFSQVYQHGDFDNKSQSRHRNGSYPRQMPSAPYQQSPELPPPLPRRSIVSTASSVHHSIASTAEIGKLSRSNNHHNSTFRHRPGQCEVEEENHYNIII